MIKLSTLLFFIFFLLIKITYSQIDTSGGRYWDPIFPNVTVTSDVPYGSNTDYSGVPQTLLMDIYEPQGDTVLLRPLIVFAHGGSFMGGSKTDGDVSALCTRFARRGYVTASIDYRYGMFPIDSVNTIKAFLRASQDMKAAIRYFRQDAAGTNTYRVHPGYVFIGGSSAGAIMALHLAYMDQPAEFPLGITELNLLGGLEGTSGNAGYASNPLAVINLCGALGDSSYLVPGDVPFVSMHGSNDAVVPFNSGLISILSFPIMNVDGSATINIRANNAGVQNSFYTWYGAVHVPYAGGSPDELKYMDSTVTYVKAFLRPFLGLPLDIKEETKSNEAFIIYPNPAKDEFTVSGLRFPVEIKIVDAVGKFILSKQLTTVNSKLQTGNLQSGIYFLKIRDSEKNILVKKIVIE